MTRFPKSLYVHIPFCEQKCLYCAFNSEAGASRTDVDDYVDALCAEIEGLAPGEVLELETVYVGGGTPTALDAPQLDRVLRTIRSRLGGRSPLEWTVEVNPGTASEDKVAVLSDAGVDRVSMGVQSFDRRRLKALGRIHTPEDVHHTVECLLRHGFRRFNLDLIYGLPGQTLEDWDRELDRLLEFRPRHVSLYALQYEEGTPYGEAYAKGRLKVAEDELLRRMFDTARNRLAAIGVELYEISNYAVPDQRSLHNQRYWRNEPYFGVGAGAFARIGEERCRNEEERRRYAALIREQGHAVVERDSLGPREDYLETLTSGLRTTEGVSRRRLLELTGIDLSGTHGPWIERLVALGLAAFDGEHLVLTMDGLWVLDTVLEPFLDLDSSRSVIAS